MTINDKETMRVSVRIRPLSNQSQSTITCLDSQVIVFNPQDRKPVYSLRKPREFKYAFDRVFDETATQQQVYEFTALPLLDKVLQGYNATVFAYGATGCGIF
jgi:hypothetical protein